jgi:hypothetical protein
MMRLAQVSSVAEEDGGALAAARVPVAAVRLRSGDRRYSRMPPTGDTARRRRVEESSVIDAVFRTRRLNETLTGHAR